MRCPSCDDGEMFLVERERTLTREVPDEADRFATRGRTVATYRLTDRVWLCRNCGKELVLMED